MMRNVMNRVRGWPLWLRAILILLVALLGLRFWLFWFGSRSVKEVAVSTLPLQAKTIDQVAADTPEELLDHLLTELDDYGQAIMAANLPLDVVSCSESYSRGQAIVPCLMRVRRTIEECRNGQPIPLVKLRGMLADSVDGYQEIYAEVLRLQVVRGKKRVPVTAPFPEFAEWTHKNIYANVAVYLLGEFDDFDSLPKMTEIWEIKKLLPVSRLFTLAVMTDLARRYPRAKLSPEAAAALDAFLNDSGKMIPAPIPMEVTAWNAPVTESDFRARILGKDVGLDKVRKIQLRIYSPQLQKYENVTNPMGPYPYGLSPEVFTWFGQMKAFVTLAYPSK